MPNYYVDQVKSNLSIGAVSGVEEPAGQVKNIVLTNVNEDGVWNEFVIQAKNFAIKDGALGSSLSETYVWNGDGVFWGASDRVDSITFTNLGVIGDVNNTVNMAVKFKAFTPSDATSIDIDLEESAEHPIGNAIHSFQIKTVMPSLTFPETVTATVTTAFGDGVLSAVGAPAFSEDMFTITSSTSMTNDFTEVLRIVFEADDGMYFPNQSMSNETSTPITGIAEYYAAFIFDPRLTDFVYATKNGKATSMITGFTAVLHTRFSAILPNPSLLNSYDNDISTHGINFFEFENTIGFPTPVAIESKLTGNHIHSVSHNPEATSEQSESTVQVVGTSGAPYNISIQKKTSLTSGVTASTNGFYNFSTRAFQTAQTSLDSKCNSKGLSVNNVLLPAATADTRYDVIISGTVAGSTTTLGAKVPSKTGDAIIKKLGTRTITIRPVSSTITNFANSIQASSFNVLVTRSLRLKNSLGRSSNPILRVLKGGTGGSLSARLVLETNPQNISTGMIVTGVGVKHNTTVSDISKNVVTLSNNCTVAAGTDITFSTNVGGLVPFSFTVPPNTGKQLSLTSGANLRKAVGGLVSVKTKINGNTNKSLNVNLDSTKGIVAGMTITGKEVKTVAGEQLAVAVVTNATAAIFTKQQSFNDNAELKFSGGNATADVNLHSIQANMSGANAVITGYLTVNEIKETADVAIYIDDIITVETV
jgi:hypothetical protein